MMFSMDGRDEGVIEMINIALQVEKPWELMKAEFDDAHEEWHFYFDFERGSEFLCPNGCGNHGCKGYDSDWKTWRDGPVPVDETMKQFPHQRLIGRADSDDFVRWSATRTVIARNAFDPPATEFYSMPVFLYQGWYIGMLYILHGDPDEQMIRKKGCMDIQLAASRDGIQ